MSFFWPHRSTPGSWSSDTLPIKNNSLLSYYLTVWLKGNSLLWMQHYTECFLWSTERDKEFFLSKEIDDTYPYVTNEMQQSWNLRKEELSQVTHHPDLSPSCYYWRKRKSMLTAVLQAVNLISIIARPVIHLPLDSCSLLDLLFSHHSQTVTASYLSHCSLFILKDTIKKIKVEFLSQNCFWFVVAKPCTASLVSAVKLTNKLGLTCFIKPVHIV